MNRITISVTAEIEAALKRQAKREGCSVSEVAREALGNHLHLVVEPGGRRRVGFAALGDSGLPGIADKIDEAIDKEWTDPEFYSGG